MEQRHAVFTGDDPLVLDRLTVDKQREIAGRGNNEERLRQRRLDRDVATQCDRIVFLGAGGTGVGEGEGFSVQFDRMNRLVARFAPANVGINRRRTGGGELPHCVDKLLGGHAFGNRTGEHIGGCIARRHRAHLVSLGGGDQLQRPLQIVLVVSQIHGQEIEQVGRPGFGLHRIDRMNNAPAHQTMPESVGDRPGQPAVFRMRHQLGELLESLRLRRRRVDLPQFGEQPGGLGLATGRLVAPVDFERRGRVGGGDGVGLVEFPAVDEAIVARGTFQVDAQEGLRDVLGILDLHRLAAVHLAAPANAHGKTVRLAVGGDQFGDHAVVRFVFGQGLVKPGGDLFPTAGDEPGAAVIVSKQVIPEGQPMLGVGGVLREQLLDEQGSLVGPLVPDEFANLVGIGKQTVQVQRQAAIKTGVVDQGRAGLLVLREVRVDDPVDRMRAPGDRGGQFGPSRFQRRFIGLFAEGEAVVPFGSLVDPSFQQGDLLGRHGGTLGGHPQVGVGGRDPLQQFALGRFAGDHALARLSAGKQAGPGVEREAAFFLVGDVALGTVLLEDRHDFMGKIDPGRPAGARDRGQNQQGEKLSHDSTIRWEVA